MVHGGSVHGCGRGPIRPLEPALGTARGYRSSMDDPFRLDGFVSDPDRLLHVVREEVSWTQQMRSRMTASMGIPYNYAGASYPEAPWHPLVEALRQRVAATLGFEITNCLMNRYPTGDHSIVWHTDDTDILAPGTGIAIVSLGAARTLRLRAGTGSDSDPFVYTQVSLELFESITPSARPRRDRRRASEGGAARWGPVGWLSACACRGTSGRAARPPSASAATGC